MKNDNNCKICQYFKEKMPFEINESLKHEKFGYCFKKHAYIIKRNELFFLLKPRSNLNSTELLKLKELNLYQIIVGKYHNYIPIPIDSCYDIKNKMNAIPNL